MEPAVPDRPSPTVSPLPASPPASTPGDVAGPLTDSYGGAPAAPCPGEPLTLVDDLPTPSAPSGAAPTLGAYDLLAEVARGGQGIVYKARHRTLGRIVALKVMQASAAARPELAERFDREVRAAARLSHPNIVLIYEVGQHEGRPFYTMAFAPGGSLAGHRRRLAADPRAAVVLVEKVARAVHYAHERGVLHRDLKPGNVLLDERGEPLVTDFGLAKILADDVELTRSGDVLGTPAYMAPEQAAGRPRQVTAAADVWALGVILYELLAGRRPFLAVDSQELARRVRTGVPPTLSTFRPEIDQSLEAIVLKCLAKEPAQRYANASLLADDLARWLRGEAVSVRPDSRPRRLWSGLRRHPFLSAALALAVAALLLLAGGLLSPRGGEPPVPVSTPHEEPLLALIGETGRPREVRWVLGENDGTLAPAAGLDEPFSLRTPDLALLEVLPAPPWPRYRIEVQVRHDDGGDHSSVGICFTYRLGQAVPVRRCGCYLLAFADRGLAAGNAALTFVDIAEPPNVHFWTKACIPPHFFRPAAPAGKDDPWRPLAVEVTPEQTRLFWKEQCIAQLSAAEMQRHGRALPSPMVPPWEYLPSGGLGLYVRDGKASFRLMTLRKLP